MAAVMIRVSVASSMIVVGAKVNEGSVVGRGEGVLIRLNRSLGVSLRSGSCRCTVGEFDAEACCRVTRVSADEAAAAGVVAAAGDADVASSSVSLPHGHMKGKRVRRNQQNI